MLHALLSAAASNALAAAALAVPAALASRRGRPALAHGPAEVMNRSAIDPGGQAARRR